MTADLPVIRALAEHLIESRVGIKSALTFRKEHLYELEGFRDLFGSVIVTALKTSKPPADFPPLPSLSIRLRDKEPYQAFNQMRAKIVGVKDGCVFVRRISKDGLAAILFGLNFPAERIEFDAQGGVAIRDDGSPNAARVGLDDVRFFREHICNGELEIWNADTEKLLGRTDPLIPMNVDLRRTVQNLQRIENDLETLLAVRSAPIEGACSI